MRRRLAALVAAATCVVGLTGCSSEPFAPGRATGVGVQLFEWTWDSIASECTDVLGPAGYSWLLTSPPNEHITGTQWWTHYQPVSYRIESDLGTREQFAAMVKTCHEAGVDVYADAVVNHMTGSDTGGIGWAGSSYQHDDYPGIWTDADFHHCGLTADDDIENYSDAAQVQTCELLNLADLDTGADHVRQRLGEYLKDLQSLGVDGFRIDAAKHMASDDIAAITSVLKPGTVIMQEVIRGAGEPIQPEQYTGNGQVYEFAWGTGLLTGTPDPSSGGFVDSDDAIVFVENHDTERNGSTPNSTQIDYVLDVVATLAADYGTPQIFSGYRYATTDDGPARASDGAVALVECPADPGPRVEVADGQMVCQHRWPATLGMLRWRAAVGDAAVTDEWTQGLARAFGRGDLGFVVLNGTAKSLVTTLTTSVPDGTYCDLVAGPPTSSGCAGGAVTVAGGMVAVDLPAHTAAAFAASDPA